MFYRLFFGLTDTWFGFNVFRYITFRAVAAAVTAFVLSLAFGPAIIRKLKAGNLGEKVRRGDDYKQLEAGHAQKEGTPTMGGLMILASVLLSTLLWARLDLAPAWLAMGAMAWMGGVGLVDDLSKLRGRGARRGLSGWVKILGQVILGLGIAWFLYSAAGTSSWASRLMVPFSKHPVFDLGFFGIIFIIVVVAGSSNSVNLTDGLDGLAIGCVGIAAFAFAVLSYLSGHVQIAEYLNILYVPGAGELTVFCAALAGASLGFLWFNSYPAQVFMGDTGSLACGAGIGVVAVLIRKELFLLLVGGVFVAEALSVLFQCSYFKLTRRFCGAPRRIFRCAPLHHHFQYAGLAENKVTVRLWICALICALIGIGALKLQ